ncbi:beta-phosphoglucomutase [Ornithinibacillus halotolerans]|uniref:Beta-phosphoglucomutase n=1 Tax=Ornithinibacillus halotolerans TaxID=1274357 RepID=A0A916W6Y2_9BACI|nr:beta-phosphoglucomutase [Ornithinibacillus halotolerans]GGA71521.1 beta-phosphoglucomutase [Ornithinibacillus halotolerans]
MKNYPKAFIFDLDGVITDTSEFHYLAWKKLADEIGIKIDREFNEKLKGISRMESLDLILALSPSNNNLSADEKERLASKKNEHYQELIQSINATNILPGIEVLLKEIRRNNIKIALGSASKNATEVLKQLGITEYFDFVVDASTVTKGKPDPETFTTAADRLHIPYEACVGVEDAKAGVEAINKAEMFSVGVGEIKHLGDAKYVVQDTSELVFEEIVKRYNDWNLHKGVR